MERYEMDLQGAQGTGLPASPYLDTTPTSEVLVRIRTENARMLKENRQSIDFTPDDTRQRLDNVYQGERPDVAARSIENRNEPSYVESATARHQRLAHRRGDTATYTRTDFTEGLDPKDIRETREPQGISHGFNPYPMPMGARVGERPVSMPSGGMRFIP
jgi:hypothetical protein